MKREIKFRGFNPKNQKWLYGYYLVNRGLHFITPDEFVNPFDTWEDYLINPDTVGQFTGLYDKNGKEIYEGDLVKYKYAYDIELVGVIKYKDAKFVIMDPEDSCYCLSDFKKDKIEIIDNIHDNPELLKDEK